MKTLLCALSVLCGSILSAADLTLTDGRVLKDATITSQSATTVTVRHAAGLASVPKTVLPVELRAQYPVSAPTAPLAVKPDADKAARIAAVRAAEQARVAKAKGAREARAQWLKDNPQPHEITYRVETTSPSTHVTTVTPEGTKSFNHQGDSYGVWSQTFTALDGFRLQLGVGSLGTGDARTDKYASDVILVISVDGAEVRREKLEPHKGSLEIAWLVGAADADQPAVARSGNGENDPTAGEWVTNSGGRSRVTHQDPGFVDTRGQ